MAVVNLIPISGKLFYTHEFHKQFDGRQASAEEVFELIYSKFPLSFALVLVGYGMILMVDKVLIEH